jgi:hypothetical protein
MVSKALLNIVLLATPLVTGFPYKAEKEYLLVQAAQLHIPKKGRLL